MALTKRQPRGARLVANAFLSQLRQIPLANRKEVGTAAVILLRGVISAMVTKVAKKAAATRAVTKTKPARAKRVVQASAPVAHGRKRGRPPIIRTPRGNSESHPTGRTA
jgi:hypothetical protein